MQAVSVWARMIFTVICRVSVSAVVIVAALLVALWHSMPSRLVRVTVYGAFQGARWTSRKFLLEHRLARLEAFIVTRSRELGDLSSINPYVRAALDECAALRQRLALHPNVWLQGAIPQLEVAPSEGVTKNGSKADGKARTRGASKTPRKGKSSGNGKREQSSGSDQSSSNVA